jgi:hypothetical protein
METRHRAAERSWGESSRQHLSEFGFPDWKGVSQLFEALKQRASGGADNGTQARISRD